MSQIVGWRGRQCGKSAFGCCRGGFCVLCLWFGDRIECWALSEVMESESESESGKFGNADFGVKVVVGGGDARVGSLGLARCLVMRGGVLQWVRGGLDAGGIGESWTCLLIICLSFCRLLLSE